MPLTIGWEPDISALYGKLAAVSLCPKYFNHVWFATYNKMQYLKVWHISALWGEIAAV